MDSTFHQIRGGIAGVYDTLTNLARVRDKSAQNLRFRALAETLIRGNIINDDQMAQALALLSYVKDKITYVRDPQAWEYVKAPELILDEIEKYGRAMGDCDDHVLFYNTLLSSLGFQTKFVAVKINGSPMFNHVVSGVLVKKKWVDLDPCAKLRPQPSFAEKINV